MSATTPKKKTSWLASIQNGIRKLNEIEVGGGSRSGTNRHRIPAKDLAEIMSLLLTLLENGLSLPKTLESLAKDRSTKRHSVVLNTLRKTIENGGSLSQGMEKFPRVFTPMQVYQIRIGQKTGALEAALRRVCEQILRRVALRKRIIKKLSYPVLITLAGAGLMIFMCVVVVPEFEKVYGSSGVDLPAVTQVVTGGSRLVLSYGWMAIPILIAAATTWIMARRKPKVSRKIDNFLLKLPFVGPWLRDVAVLQFVDGISAMVACGYTPVEAVEVAVDCVKNLEVRAAAADIRASVQRGEKLSEQIERHERFFSATLCQLIAVGERSGDFNRSMRSTGEHLQNRLENRIDATVGMLEPILTISLAVAIGAIVLSIYTPMFHMFEVLE